MKQICIIMATYQGERYLASQIDSIIKNTNQNIELHIFDDGSTDNTFAIAEKYAGRFPEKIYATRNAKNRGVVHNFLEATISLEADYYMYCDQDDVWLPEKIQKTMDYMKRQEEACTSENPPVVVFSDAIVTDADLAETAPSFQRQSGYATSALDLPHLLMENKLIGCTMMFNRAARDRLVQGKIPPAIRMHDWWLALIGAAFGTVAYLDEPLLLYRQHEHNVVGGSSKGSYLKDRASHLRRNREALYATMAQASSFLSAYENELSPEKAKILRLFAELPEKNWLARRFYIIKYGFLKSGLIRNAGVMLVV